MTPAYSEISFLKLVLADYLQVLELHLFAILQTWKTLIPGRGWDSGEKSNLTPGIRIVDGVNRPGMRPGLYLKFDHVTSQCDIFLYIMTSDTLMSDL